MQESHFPTWAPTKSLISILGKEKKETKAWKESGYAWKDKYSQIKEEAQNQPIDDLSTLSKATNAACSWAIHLN